MLNAKEMAALMSDCDVVFHSAAFVAVEKINEDLMFKINVQGTQSIVNAAIESGVHKLVHFSSIHAFKQQPTNEPLVESRPLVSDPRHYRMIDQKQRPKNWYFFKRTGIETQCHSANWHYWARGLQTQ